MQFGDSEIVNAVFKKLDPWLNNPPDFDDVQKSYNQRGELLAKKTHILREIEIAEDEILTDASNKPRSNETRIKKLEATRVLRDRLSHIESQLAIIDNDCKLLEFRKSMFSAAIYRTKIQFDL